MDPIFVVKSLDEYISTSPFSSPNSISSARDLLLAAWRKMKGVPASFSELYHCQYVDLDSSLKPSEPVFSNLKITGKFMSILIQFGVVSAVSGQVIV